MALTRILNNQVTDSSAGNTYLGINAGTKVQDYSVTAGKLANNLTYASNLTVQGNLDVQGTTTTIDTYNVVIEDPLLLLAKDQTGSPSYDIGYIGERGSSDNIAFAWIEANDEFATIFTNTVVSNTTVNVVSYANFHTFDANVAGNLTVGGTTSIGNVTIGNISVTGQIDATGNITGGNLISNGSATVTTTATVGNLSTAGFVAATGNISGGNLISNGSATVTTTATVGNLSTAGAVNATGNITGGNLNSNGTITGTTLTTTGTATVGNISTAGTIDATGNISGGNLISNNNISGATLNTTGNAVIGGNLIVQGNITYINIDDLRVEDPIIILGTGPNGAPLTTNDGRDRGVYMEYYTTGLGNAFMGWDNSTGNMVIASSVSFSGNDIVAVTAYGTLEAGNIYAQSLVSTGTATVGNLSTAGAINATGNITGGNLNSNGTITGTTITTTSTGTFGNVSTAGTVNATGNITGGNLNSNGTITGTTLTTTGTATVGNLSTAGTVDATGNIAGGNLTSNGALTVTTTGTLGNLEVSGTGNIVGKTIIGNAALNSANTANAALAVGASTSVLIAVGNTAQRPDVGVTGMLRFNTSTDSLEYYDNDSWSSAGTTFTVVVADSFVGNGVANTFTLSQNSTTAATIVSINGIVQIPTTAYSVSGNVLTFTEAPEISDAIDARLVTTTTTVTNITNASGNAVIEALDSSATIQVTGNLLPAANVTYDLGSNTVRWNDAYFNGTTITLGNVQIKNSTGTTIGFFGPDGTTPATIDSTNIDTTSIANGTSNMTVIESGGNIRANVGGATILQITSAGIINGQGNGVGNIGNAAGFFNTIFAKATSAQYADLAEMYEADAIYEPGTVVCFGGDKEITSCTTDACRRVAGVISTNPSYIMNAGLGGDYVVAVALTGRVPTRVTGIIRKGDMLVATSHGRARAEPDPVTGSIIGKALADFDGADGVIEVVVGRL